MANGWTLWRARLVRNEAACFPGLPLAHGPLTVTLLCTDNLAISSDLFHQRATKTRRFMQCRYYKMIALVVFIIIAIILFIVLIVEIS